MTTVRDRPITDLASSIATRRSRARQTCAAAAAVGVPTAAFVVHAAQYGRWIVDDAAITFAYARSVADGLGPVLQPGAPPVEGYSNPAWLALLVAGRWLGLFDVGAWWGAPDVVAFPKLLGLLCAVGVFACFYAIARALTSRPALAAAAAGMVLACVPSWVIWLVSGLENGLLALAVAGLAAVLVRTTAAGRLLAVGPAAACGLLAAVAALTRPDGLIYAGAYPAVVLLLLGRGQLARAAGVVAASAAAFVAPVGAYFAWRHVTFGAWLPNTALAKDQSTPGLDALQRPTELVGYLGLAAVLLGVALVAAALARPWPARPGLVALLVPLGLAVAAFSVLEPDWMGQYRFATPVWTLGAITAAVAAARVLPVLAARGRIIVALVAGLAAAASGTSLIDGAQQFRAAPTVPMCSIAAHMGWTFNGYADLLGLRRGTLVTPDVGGTGLTSRLSVVDLAGLVDEGIARRWAAQDMTGLRDMVFEGRPEFIETHHGWSSTTGLVDDPRLAAGWAEIRRSAPTDGVWVRRDLVADVGALDALRRWDREVAQPVERRFTVDAPRSSCGPRLGITAAAEVGY